jgi:glutathione S-transferase
MEGCTCLLLSSNRGGVRAAHGKVLSISLLFIRRAPSFLRNEVMPTLYYSAHLNPRLCVAAARHLNAAVRFEAAAPLDPERSERFTRLNPNLRVPILEMDDGSTLWEADAIACQLARMSNRLDFFPDGAQLPDVLRWLSWTAMHWGLACSGHYYQHLLVPRYGLPPLVDSVMAEHEFELQRLAPILEAHLARRRWMLGDTLSYVDFRIGAILPFSEEARVDVSGYPAIARLAAQLNELPAWRDPFAGL